MPQLHDGRLDETFNWTAPRRRGGSMDGNGACRNRTSATASASIRDPRWRAPEHGYSPLGGGAMVCSIRPTFPADGPGALLCFAPRASLDDALPAVKAEILAIVVDRAVGA